MKSSQRGDRDPERWTELRSDGPQGAAGAALRRARDATVPGVQDVARLNVRLAAQTDRPAAGPWRWRLALAAVVLLSTGGVVGAAGLLLRRMRQAAPPTVAPSVAMTPSVEVRRRPRHAARQTPPGVVPQESPAQDAPALAPAPAQPIVEASRVEASPPARERIASATPRATTERRAPITEAGLLADAFRALRANQDAAAALRALDGYDRVFPDGTLAAEARVARADALMALGRRTEALAVLETFDGTRGAPTRNVLVMRGELLAEAGHCARAVHDFDTIMRTQARGDAEARALFGRAACRLREGDVATGRQDLQRYLELYPDGPFAAAARTALAP